MKRMIFKLTVVGIPVTLLALTSISHAVLSLALGVMVASFAILITDVIRRDYLGKPGFFEKA